MASVAQPKKGTTYPFNMGSQTVGNDINVGCTVDQAAGKHYDMMIYGFMI